MTCHNIVELLPWFVNGTLAEEEKATLLEHLAVCEGCRAELEATGEAWQIFGQHVPSFDLVEYALGQVPGELDHEHIERHLAVCPSCRAEVDLVAADNALIFETPHTSRIEADPPRRASNAPLSRSRSAQVWRSAVLAAGLTSVLASGYLLSSVGGYMRHDDSIVTAQTQEPQVTLVKSEEETSSSPAAASSIVFSDGFESSELNAWSSVQ